MPSFTPAEAAEAERARQAALQSDHERPYDRREAFFDPLADVSPARRWMLVAASAPDERGWHVPQMVRELEDDAVIAALCGEMGRVA